MTKCWSENNQFLLFIYICTHIGRWMRLGKKKPFINDQITSTAQQNTSVILFLNVLKPVETAIS